MKKIRLALHMSILLLVHACLLEAGQRSKVELDPIQGIVSTDESSNFPSIFVPDTYVPLSPFVQINTASTTLELNVAKELLIWLEAQNATLKIAQYDANGVLYKNPTAINQDSATIKLAAANPGVYVAISEDLKNDYPIVTHWNQTLNNGRGGQQEGASDALGFIDADIFSNTPTIGGLNIKNANPNHAHPQSNNDDGLYAWATDKYALYSDGSEETPAKDTDVADADTPGYERYMGENFATSGVSEAAAIWLSNLILEETGFPLQHRNSSALNNSSPDLLESAPLFQIVHAHIVRHDDPDTLGREDSLATFILPPLWEKSPAQAYPVIFTGFYDIHGTTFNQNIIKTRLKTQASIFNEHNQGIVGILWNGGGASGSLTFQRSAYDNVAKLFSEAQNMLTIDVERIVMQGGSRGGGTALAMAANPYHNSYKVPYVLVSNPQTQPSQNIDGANPTYALVTGSMPFYLGYKNAWKPGWTLPGSPDIDQSMLWKTQLFGRSETQTIKDQHEPGSPNFINALKDKGTKIVLHTATHDVSKPFMHMTRFVQKVRDAQIPIQMNIHYRFGHGHALNLKPDVVPLLKKLLGDNTPFSEETVHIRRQSAAEHTQGVVFDPEERPLVVEAPLLFGSGQFASMILLGEPGTLIEFHAGSLGEEKHLLLSTKLEADAGEGFAWHHLPLYGPQANPLKIFSYEITYSIDAGQSWQTLGSQSTATPNFFEPLSVVINTPHVGAGDESRTGGVCGDGAL